MDLDKRCASLLSENGLNDGSLADMKDRYQLWSVIQIASPANSCNSSSNKSRQRSNYRENHLTLQDDDQYKAHYLEPSRLEVAVKIGGSRTSEIFCGFLDVNTPVAIKKLRSHINRSQRTSEYNDLVNEIRFMSRFESFWILFISFTQTT